MNEAVNSGLQVAQAITEYGMLIICASAFVVLTIAIVLFLRRMLTNFDSRYDQLLKEVVSKQSNAPWKEEFSKMNTTLTDLKNCLNENFREECTYRQTSQLLQSEFKSTRLTVFEFTLEIISINHIEDVDKVEKKITLLIKNTNNKLVSNLNNYKFKGHRIGTFIGSDWQTEVYPIIKDYIYSKPKRNPEKFLHDLEAMFENLFNDTTSTIISL